MAVAWGIEISAVLGRASRILPLEAGAPAFCGKPIKVKEIWSKDEKLAEPGDRFRPARGGTLWIAGDPDLERKLLPPRKRKNSKWT